MITYTFSVTHRHPWHYNYLNSFGHIEVCYPLYKYSTLEIDGVSACMVGKYSWRIAVNNHRRLWEGDN